MVERQTQLRVVLVRPALAENIGAVARVMHNFGLSRLCLVEPEAEPLDERAVATATHGEAVLRGASRHATLDDAVADCVLVAATSARLGGLFRGQSVATVRDFAPTLAAAAQERPAALVFGPERTGLLTEEVARCHWLLTIPTAAENPVLNLAQAVTICLYEHHLAGPLLDVKRVSFHDVAEMAAQQRAFAHFEEALTALHFLWNEKSAAQMHAIRHWLGRAAPSQMELDLLHGIARQMLWYVRRQEVETGKKVT